MAWRCCGARADDPGADWLCSRKGDRIQPATMVPARSIPARTRRWTRHRIVLGVLFRRVTVGGSRIAPRSAVAFGRGDRRGAALEDSAMPALRGLRLHN